MVELVPEGEDKELSLKRWLKQGSKIWSRAQAFEADLSWDQGLASSWMKDLGQTTPLLCASISVKCVLNTTQADCVSS